jgi:hypothetical protein
VDRAPFSGEHRPGINPETPRPWLQRAAIDAGQHAGLTTDEKAERAPAA